MHCITFLSKNLDLNYIYLHTCHSWDFLLISYSSDWLASISNYLPWLGLSVGLRLCTNFQILCTLCKNKLLHWISSLCLCVASPSIQGILFVLVFPIGNFMDLCQTMWFTGSSYRQKYQSELRSSSNWFIASFIGCITHI